MFVNIALGSILRWANVYLKWKLDAFHHASNFKPNGNVHNVVKLAHWGSTGATALAISRNNHCFRNYCISNNAYSAVWVPKSYNNRLDLYIGLFKDFKAL